MSAVWSQVWAAEWTKLRDEGCLPMEAATLAQTEADPILAMETEAACQDVLGRDHEGWGCHREAQVYYAKAAGFRAAADILRKAIELMTADKESK